MVTASLVFCFSRSLFTHHPPKCSLGRSRGGVSVDPFIVLVRGQVLFRALPLVPVLLHAERRRESDRSHSAYGPPNRCSDGRTAASPLPTQATRLHATAPL